MRLTPPKGMIQLGPTVVAAWVNFFDQIAALVSDNAQSGTTSQRPTQRLYPGRPYFDESLGALGKPIWVNKNASGWVDSSGTSV